MSRWFGGYRSTLAHRDMRLLLGGAHRVRDRQLAYNVARDGFIPGEGAVRSARHSDGRPTVIAMNGHNSRANGSPPEGRPRSSSWHAAS